MSDAGGAPVATTAAGDDALGPEEGSVVVLGELLGLRPVNGGAAPETHRAFPNAEHPRFYVPITSRRAAAASCLAYNRLRPAKVARRRSMVGWGLRTGLLQRMQGTAMTSGAPSGRFAATGTDPLGPLVDELERRLGRGPLAYATSPRHLDPFWTPTLQLFAEDGRPVAYAKVGWTPLTRRHVTIESDTLALLGARDDHRFRSPDLLDRFDWGDAVVSVAAPMPDGVARVEPTDASMGPVIARALADVAAIDGPPTIEPFADSGGAAWADRLVAGRAEGASPAVEHGRRRFGEAWAVARELVGTTPVLLGRWHGDWVPWNLARAGDQLWVWDWEYSGERRPVGLDTYHWHYQQSHIVDGATVPEALTRSRILGAQSLDSSGQRADTEQVLACAHVLELAARSLEAAVLGAPGHEAALDDLAPLCDELVARARTAGSGATP